MKLNKEIKNIIFSIGNLELFKDDIIENNTKKSKKKKKDKNKSSKNNVLRNTDNQEEKKIKEIKLSSYKDKNKHNPVKKQNRINPQNNQNNNAFYFINTNIDKNQGKNKKNKKKKIIKKSIKIMKYNEEELNNLPYHLALKRDQRTYCQYYISLLKTKHDLFFSFFNNRDYNSKIIKIDIFFISFTICYTVNALFFDDSTMHKIYVDQGSFNCLYQLPQIIYSSLISIVLNKPLKLLGLSEEDILNLKKIKKIKNLDKKAFKLNKKLKIKFAFYFIISQIFLLFFWYYLSMFCAIYRNTQAHLIKDTLFSFCSELIENLGFCLIPGIFRIPSLSDPKNEKKYLYKFSLFLQNIL